MSHAISQVLSQQMRMEQRLTPQLIQSMAVLQKPVAELETYLREAMEANPALELEEPTGIGHNGQAQQAQPEPRLAEETARFSRLSDFARTYGRDILGDDRAPAFRRAADSGSRDAKMELMANVPDRGANLHDYLREQWSIAELGSEEVRQAGEHLIAAIEPDGYLRVPMEETAQRARPPIPAPVLKEALEEIQLLDPPGVGARDLQECLLLQLEALPGDNRIEYELLAKQFANLLNNRLPAIARETGYSIGEITEAIRAMRSQLVMHPGLLVGDHGERPVRPDVIVEYADTGGGLTIRLTRGNMPKLRVSEQLREIAQCTDGDPELRNFARRRVDEANGLIDAVQFRRGRLLEVTAAMIRHQREFFDSGMKAMKGLRMSELAEELNCDPSTISRTVAEKYMQTPLGIFPMRIFFSGGAEMADGENASWDSVRQRVREFIAAENPNSPYTDDQVADHLRVEGIELSRRTIAKYRHQMDIPAAKRRRSFE
jgi:RNA polymerase sigma-54 factor